MTDLYTRRFSFAGYQANQPHNPVPGQRLDIEFDEIAARLTRVGASAYQIAVLNGFVGTEAQWIESLKSMVPGPPGTGGQSFEFIQDQPSSVWIINHNLGYRPVVSILTLTGEAQYIGYKHDTLNTLRVLAEVECTGKVVCF